MDKAEVASVVCHPERSEGSRDTNEISRYAQDDNVLEDNNKTLRKKAIDLLARREHCYRELQQKLRQRGFALDAITVELQRLVSEGLLSDVRFTEAYVHYRQQRGYGPLRIAAELQEKGVEQALIAKYISEDDNYWYDLIAAVKQKKFADEVINDFQQKAKQMRFLQYRGFTNKQIQSVVDEQS